MYARDAPWELDGALTRVCVPPSGAVRRGCGSGDSGLVRRSARPGILNLAICPRFPPPGLPVSRGIL